MNTPLRAIALAAFLSTTSACGHNPVKVVATILDLAADVCVELARLHGNGTVETICATHEDVLPIIVDILSQKAGAPPVATMAEDLVCVHQGQDRLCVTRAELLSKFDDIAARSNARIAAGGK